LILRRRTDAQTLGVLRQPNDLSAFAIFDFEKRVLDTCAYARISADLHTSADTGLRRDGPRQQPSVA